MRDFDVKALGRVAVFMGGCSAEREISLLSGNRVLKELQQSCVDAHAVDIDEVSFVDFAKMQFDRAFIGLHGGAGENGRLQGVLESLDIPYTGSGLLASALAMDKYRSKLVWRAAGLSVPKAIIIDRHTDIRDVVKKLSLPLVVKPICAGSSQGVSIVTSIDDFPRALTYGEEFGSQLIAEQYIKGREFTVGIFDDKVLPAIELHVEREFYDFQAKYKDPGTHYQVRCDLSPKLTITLENIALLAYQLIGCQQYARIDLIKDADDNFWILEINTIPGMREGGTYPAALDAAQIPFKEFVLSLLQYSKKQQWT